MTADGQPTVHDTFAIVRKYSRPCGRVFAALANAATVRRWYAEGPHRTVVSFDMDFRVGGPTRSVVVYTGGPLDGVQFVNAGHYLDIVTDRRVVMSTGMTAGDRRISASLVTFELVDLHGGGTQLLFTHQGAFFEGADGPRMRESGWGTLLDRLAVQMEA